MKKSTVKDVKRFLAACSVRRARYTEKQEEGKQVKRNKLKDVEKFLAAFLDHAVDRGVGLITHAMTDCEGRHCLLGELLTRGGGYAGHDELTEELGRRLGIHPNKVVDIIEGWDRVWGRGTLPFERLGRRLRTRYLLRNKRVTEASA